METGQQSPPVIPEMFRAAQAIGLKAAASSKAPMPLGGSSTSADGAISAQNTMAPPILPLHAQQAQSLSLADLQANLQAMAMDIKSSFAAAITDIRADIQGIAVRTGAIEQASARQTDAIKQIQKNADMHLGHIIEIHRHLEDLDNRGRRHNIRIRGVPEMPDQIPVERTAETIFNDILERPPDSPIEFERVHRALRPRGRENDPPRDIICSLSRRPY